MLKKLSVVLATSLLVASCATTKNHKDVSADANQPAQSPIVTNKAGQACSSKIIKAYIPSLRQYADLIKTAIEVNNIVVKMTFAHNLWIHATMNDIGNHLRYLYNHGPQPKHVHHDQQAFYVALENYKKALVAVGLDAHEYESLLLPTRAMALADKKYRYALGQAMSIIHFKCDKDKRNASPKASLPIFEL